MREKKRFLHVGLRATRALALFKSVIIRVLRFIRVLFLPNTRRPSLLAQLLIFSLRHGAFA